MDLKAQFLLRPKTFAAKLKSNTWLGATSLFSPMLFLVNSIECRVFIRQSDLVPGNMMQSSWPLPRAIREPGNRWHRDSIIERIENDSHNPTVISSQALAWETLDGLALRDVIASHDRNLR